MKKIWRIAITEYLNSVRSKAFVIALLTMPLMMGASLFVQTATIEGKDKSDRKIAIVDLSGRLLEPLKEAARLRNDDETVDENGRRTASPFSIEGITPESDEETTIVELSDRVRNGELFAFALIDKGIFDASVDEEYLFRYYTQTPTYKELPDWLEQRVNDEIQNHRFREAGLDRDRIEAISRPRDLEKLGLAEIQEDGQVGKAEKHNQVQNQLIPVAAMALMTFMVMTCVPTLLNSTLEEKTQKIAEFLLSAVTPFQLLSGKLIGGMFLTLTLSGIYFSGVTFILYKLDFLHLMPASLVLWFIFLVVLATLLHGSICIAVGSVCTEMRDAQSLMFPIMFTIVIPILIAMPAIENPSSFFVRAFSFFPPTAPPVLLMRMAVPPGLPSWEIALSVGLTALFTLATVLAAAKIFRIGFLAQGQTPTMAQLIKWVFTRQ
ncbi:MAG: ABC transporter permease [Verrucomicrobiota bacterium]